MFVVVVVGFIWNHWNLNFNFRHLINTYFWSMSQFRQLNFVGSYVDSPKTFTFLSQMQTFSIYNTFCVTMDVKWIHFIENCAFCCPTKWSSDCLSNLSIIEKTMYGREKNGYLKRTDAFFPLSVPFITIDSTLSLVCRPT